MNHAQLRAFHAVAEAGGFTRAPGQVQADEPSRPEPEPPLARHRPLADAQAHLVPRARYRFRQLEQDRAQGRNFQHEIAGQGGDAGSIAGS